MADRHRVRILTYLDGQVAETDDLDADRPTEASAESELPEPGRDAEELPMNAVASGPLS